MSLAPSYYQAIEKHISDKKEFTLFCTANPFPLFTDIVLRVIFIFLLKSGNISQLLFYSLNIFLTVITIFFTFWIYKGISKKFEGEITNIHFIASLNVKYSVVILAINILLWFLIDAAFFEVAFLSWIFKIVIQMLIFIIYLIYEYTIIDNSITKDVDNIIFYPNEKDSKFCCALELFDKYNGTNVSGAIDGSQFIHESKQVKYDIDKLNSKIEFLKSKIETFTFESTLLGGICFAGFLTIIASDKVQENLIIFQELPNKFSSLISSVLNFNFDNCSSLLNSIFSGYLLYALIALQTIICSFIFALVLFGKNKFTEYYGEIIQKINLFKYLNDSEELDPNKTIDNINIKNIISHQHNDLQIALINVMPFYRIIFVLRYIGILSFYFLLLACTLIFSIKLSFVFLVLLMLEFIIRYLINKFHLGIIKN